MHHIAVDWPDAHVSGYEPSTNGPLPDDFSGAGSDVVVISESIAPMNALRRVRHFCRRQSFPAVLFIGDETNAELREKVLELGAAAAVFKDDINHEIIVDAVNTAIRFKQDLASTQSLFMSDEAGNLAMRGYRLIEKLSGGEFSSVYLVEGLKDNRLQVLKVVRQVPDATEKADEVFHRFLQEFELINSLSHPNIVSINDFGVGDDHAFIAMEYFPAGDLRARIREGFTTDAAIQATIEIGGALSVIHGLGILHRDLKPGNIMCRQDGSLALIDFGLAKQLALAAEITGTGEIFGTPYYMSPEQGHGKTADVRSDIYSLGVIFYEMLTGEKPFVADTAMGIIYKHSNAERPQLPAGQQHFQSVLDRMLAIDRSDRFASADLALSALSEL